MASFINAPTSGPGGLAMQGDGSGILQIQANNTPYITITPGASGNVVSIPTGVGGTPAFSAYSTATTSLPVSTFVKVPLATVEFDTTGAFDNVTNYRYNPKVAGYYQVNSMAQVGSVTAALYVCLYKNGSVFKLGGTNGNNANATKEIGRAHV